MTLGNIQRVKVVIIRLDLAVVLDRVAHRDKNVLDLLPQDRDHVQMACSRPAAGNSDIDRFAFVFERRDPFVKTRFGGLESLAISFRETEQPGQTRPAIRRRLCRSLSLIRRRAIFFRSVRP